MAWRFLRGIVNAFYPFTQVEPWSESGDRRVDVIERRLATRTWDDSFDFKDVAVGMAESASVATLCGGNTGYPDFDWDHAALSLRTPAGEPIAPSWKTANVARNPECERCRG